MKISFVVASVDRDEDLKKCIASIEHAHEARPDIALEVLVVFQRAKQTKAIPVRYPDLVRFFYIDQMGLSVSRNFAIAQSTGDYLVFLDDDAGVQENFVEVLVKSVELYPDVQAFCGRLIDLAQNAPFSVLFKNNRTRKINWLDFQYFMGSAHVLSRKVIARIGLYDERFGVGARYRGSEETDMFFRLRAAREAVIYLPDLVFFHPIPVTPPNYVYNYAYAIGAATTKNCLKDKGHCFYYGFILGRIIAKVSIRLLQKNLFKGEYQRRDEKYHYASVLKGVFQGIKDFIKDKS